MPERSANHVAFGAALRALRLEAELSQEDLAYRSGLHRTYVGGIERGERNPSLTNIGRLAVAVGVKVSELMARAEALQQRGSGASGT